MTVPIEFKTAGVDFERFLTELRRLSMLATRNQCYAMARAVLMVFRSHMEPQTALNFANELPPVLRAIFVTDWNLTAPVLPFPTRERLTDEVLSVREEHNTAPRTAISDVAAALKSVMNPLDHARMIGNLPPDAAAFWRTD